MNVKHASIPLGMVFLILTACSRAPGASTLTPEPTAANTLTTTAPAIATIPPTPTPTVASPTDTPPPATPTGVEATAATPPASPSATITATLGDRAEFVSDVTVPDGSDYPPGTQFIKTWRVKNSGTSTWTPAYALVFVSGARMGGPDSVPLPGNVPPGQTVDLSVELTAPADLGRYTGFWQLRTTAGGLFGIGANANEPIYVQIDVAAASNPSPGPTTAPGQIKVTAATLSVDRATVTATCPQTFTFSGALTSEGAGTITYQLEAAADTPGFKFDLPASVNSTFTNAGPRTFAVTYSLEFRASVSGQAWLHILTSNDLISDKVSFNLTCQP